MPIINAPIEPPTKPAKLHKPWKLAIMLRPYKRSTPTAWVLTDMLYKFPQMPNRYNEPISNGVELASPSNNSAAGYNIDATDKMVLLPCFVTRLPETKRPVICPIGNANNTPPNAALLKCKASFISGMRLAQLEKVSPKTK